MKKRLVIASMLVALIFYHLSICVYAEEIIVTADQANIRSGPGTTHDRVTMANRGTTFPLLEATEGWYKIRLASEGTGWISTTVSSRIVPSANSDIHQVRYSEDVEYIGNMIEAFHRSLRHISKDEFETQQQYRSRVNALQIENRRSAEEYLRNLGTFVYTGIPFDLGLYFPEEQLFCMSIRDPYLFSCHRFGGRDYDMELGGSLKGDDAIGIRQSRSDAYVLTGFDLKVKMPPESARRLRALSEQGKTKLEFAFHFEGVRVGEAVIPKIIMTEARIVTSDGQKIYEWGSADSVARQPHASTDLRVRRVIEANLGEVRCVRFSPDGKYLVTIGTDSQVLVWQTNNFTLDRRMNADGNARLYDFAFSPDGTLVAVVGDKQITVFNFSNGVSLHREPNIKIGSWWSFSNVAFSADGKILVLGGGNKIRVLSTTDWENICEREVSSGWYVNDMVFSPNDGYLFIAMSGGTVEVIGAGGWDKTRSIRPGNSNAFAKVSISTDGQIMAILASERTEGRSDEKAIWLYRLTGDNPTLIGSEGVTVNSTALASSGPSVAILDIYEEICFAKPIEGGRLGMVKMGMPAATVASGYHITSANCIAASPNSKYIAVGTSLPYNERYSPAPVVVWEATD